ncbi:redox-sensitive bicupin YhaK (pirin superfamily) [Comamonas odontotermitis]|uniref:Redox-sensitive bicupin YhaK (Pirin superfamily) n=1 Tax=Comamonas odontotermitis TaxID=379895 RepID=A0ABR6RAV8_9BURK|nr:pirin family protein [Comamonas odontotermitis]MBB6576269.1 redox-sensitive bicupin YhaK (pirin superfamily) [Comamonas odontotermitis]
MDSTPLNRYPGRVADVGGVPVLRALPNRARRMVGAWCFLDHAGPSHFDEGPGMQVGPHPHTCLQTFTWMIEGEVLHRDSLGSEQPIRPGQVNLMTAGKGIAHSEESLGKPDFHAVQLWIALPKEQRFMPPRFQHYPVLPRFSRQGLQMTVLAGEWEGQRAPTEVHSPLVAVDMEAGQPASATLALRPDFEYGVLCLYGDLQVNGQTAAANELIYLPEGGSTVDVQCGANSRFILLGGEPYEGGVLIWWNFVGQSQEEIEGFLANWNQGIGFGEAVASPLPPLTAPTLDGVHLRQR